MKTMRKRLIVVLGMHRSGTSAITRALNVLGVELGDRLMSPTESINDKGFFEDIDFNTLNVEMLQVLDSDWHCLAPIELDDVSSLHQKGYFLRAVNLLRQKTANVPIFGFKDPRVAKLLPFWHAVFVHCEFDLSYVLAIRNPLSVAQSLAKRDGFSHEKSYMLWLGYVLTSLAFTKEHRRVLIDYDHFLHASQQDLELIADRLDLQINPQALHEYQAEFLDVSLRHTVYTVNDLTTDQACPPLVRELYAVLLDASRDKQQIDQPAFNSSMELRVNEFDRLKANFRLADQLSAQIASLNQSIAGHDEKILDLIVAVLEQDQDAFQKEFNPGWYLNRNTDVAAAGVDPYQHYIRSGASERRFPSADLVAFIRAALPDHLHALNKQLNQASLLADAKLLELAEMEMTFSAQLLKIKDSHEQQKGELKREHAEREQTTLIQLAQARQLTETQLLIMAEREKAFSEQLRAIRQVHGQQKDEQNFKHAEREQATLIELAQARQQIETQLLILAEREKAFSEQLQAIQQVHGQQQDEQNFKHAEREQATHIQLIQARQQIETQLLTLAEREKAFSEQLQAIQQVHGQQKDEQNFKHAEREQATHIQLAQARQQIETQLLALAEREKTFSEQLQAIQKMHGQQKDEQNFKHAEREQATLIQQAQARQQIETQLVILAEREKAFAGELQEKQNELQRLTRSWAEAEKVQMQVLAQLRRELHTMQATYSWRWTAPLRNLGALLKQKDADNDYSARSSLLQPSVLSLSLNEPQDRDKVSLSTAHEQEPPINTNNRIADMSLNQTSSVASTLDELLSYHDESFIHRAYHTLLGRAPDPEGFRYYLARIQAGIDKVEILAQMRRGREGQAHSEKLAGLDAAIRKNSRKRWPLIGSWFADSAKENQIRIQLLENKLRFIEAKLDRQFNSLGRSLEGLLRFPLFFVFQQTTTMQLVFPDSVH